MDLPYWTTYLSDIMCQIIYEYFRNRALFITPADQSFDSLWKFQFQVTYIFWHKKLPLPCVRAYIIILPQNLILYYKNWLLIYCYSALRLLNIHCVVAASSILYVSPKYDDQKHTYFNIYISIKDKLYFCWLFCDKKIKLHVLYTLTQYITL